MKFFQKFYTIDSAYFYSSLYSGFDKVENRKFYSYPWVIPVYVYSINDIWDGTKSFDICPKNFGDIKNKDESWAWRRSHTVSDIGKEIFMNEDECWEHWNEIYKGKKVKEIKRQR